MADDAGFKAGSAYLDLDVRDQTAEGMRRIKEKIERGDHIAVPVGIDSPDAAAFREKLLAAIKSIKLEVPAPTLGDPVTPQWKRDTDEKTRQYKPPPVKTEATDPIDAAWRAKVNGAIRSIASDALKIPVTPETEQYRAEVRSTLLELQKSTHQKIPVELSDAEKFKAQAELLAKETAAKVKAKIPVEVDKETAEPKVTAAASDLGKSFTSAFGNGIAPMPALIGAAVLAGAPLIGPAMIGVVGVGMAAAATAIASGQPAVMDRWMALTSDLGKQADLLKPRLTAPIVDALDTIRDRFGVLAPQVGNDLVSAESAIKPLTDGLLNLASRALPGVTLAVAAQGPVMQGFKTLMDDTGQSVGDMFESFSHHSLAFGADTASLGRIVQSAMQLITNVVNQTGEAWAAHSGQITSAISSLTSGLSQLSGSAVPALTAELANVLSVLGFLATAAGAVSTAIGPLSGDLMAVAISAKLLGVNLTAIPGLLRQLPVALAAAAEGGGRFAGVAGQLAGVLPTVTSVVSGIAAPLGIAAIYMSTVAQRAQDIKDAGTAMGQGLVAGGTAAADAATKMRQLQEQSYNLQGQLADATQQQNMLTTSIELGRGGASAAGAQAKQYSDRIAEIKTELDTANKAQEDYKQQLGPLGVAQAQAAQAQKDYNDAVTKFGAGSSQAEGSARQLASANAEVASQQQNLNNAMSITKASMGDFEKPAIALQADLAKIGDAASTDSEKITAMKDALIQLSGGAIPVGDAMEAIDKVMTSIDQQMTQGVNHADGYGKALLNADGTIRTITKNGQSFRDTLTDLRGKFVDAAAAITAEDEAQGKSADQAKAHAQAVLEQQIPAIEKLGEKMGLTKDQVDNALKSMGAWPADLTTVVSTPGALQSQQAMDILRGKVMDVPNDHTIHTTALTAEAIQQLRDLGLVVTTLPDGTVTITGNTALAYAAAQTLIRDINGMHATVTVNAQGNTSSVRFTATGSVMSAQGNLLAPMADGGLLGKQITAMSGAQATMVPPNTWRVVGDNMRVPELYAPLDGSPRTRANIAAAAQHEGLPVGIPAPRRAVTINQTVISSDPQQAADRAAGAVAWAMSSARG